jgi:hypothetical protein
LFEPIDFPSQMVPYKFSLDLSLFGLGPSSKGHGFNLWLSSNRIALLDPHLKVMGSTYDSHPIGLLYWALI